MQGAIAPRRALCAGLWRALSVNARSPRHRGAAPGAAPPSPAEGALADWPDAREGAPRSGRPEASTEGRQEFARLTSAGVRKGSRWENREGTGTRHGAQPHGDSWRAGDSNWPVDGVPCPRLREALKQQRERCESAPVAKRNVFDEWCASDGILDDLHAAFRVHPFPSSYFGHLADFEDRVLRPHDAQLENKLGA
jgi:hypothetical protein